MSWNGQAWRKRAENAGRGLSGYEVHLRGEAVDQLRAEMGGEAFTALDSLKRIDLIRERAKKLAKAHEARLRSYKPL
ncbi:MAG: hypothetical protein ACRD1P_07340 [Thermoanaerobaculia bacterium]